MAKRKAARRGLWRRNVILPVVGVLAVGAAVAGLQIGHSAVAQIDPVYHRGGVPIARDVSGQARALPRSAYADASSWEEGQRALAQDCGADCPRLRARDLWDARPAGEQRIALPPPVSLDGETGMSAPPVVAQNDPPPAPGHLDRYLHYPVSHEGEPPPPSYSAPVASSPPAGSRGEPEGM